MTKRKFLIAGAVLAMAGGLAAGCSTAGQAAVNALPPATATISRTTLVETRTIPGTLAYGEPVPVRTTGTGTLTSIAPVGSTIEQGDVLFEVDGRPVVAFYGSIPLFQSLRYTAEDAEVDGVARAEAQVDSARADVVIAESEFAGAQREWARKLAEAELEYGGATETYADVFRKWLGLELDEDDMDLTPAAVLAEWDMDLETLFDDARRLTGMPQNDPATPWNEQVIFTWQNLYAGFTGSLVPSCPNGQHPGQGTCIELNMQEAWFAHQEARDALNATSVQASKALNSAEQAVARAKDALLDAAQRLDAERTVAAEKASGAGLGAVVVQQIQENLAALGYTGFSINGVYDAATAEAVRSWQSDVGLPQTGVVEQGQVVFIPEPVRISEHTARVGDAIGSGPVLSYTGTSRLVTVDLRIADQALAEEGRQVSVAVPGRGTVTGTISNIGAVVANGNIQVTVTIDEEEDLGSLDAAPVDVDFVSRERQDVLVAPVAALLALAEGGYGVEVVDGNTTRIVAVRTGMFAGGRVEISGEGIAEGMTVGVPR